MDIYDWPDYMLMGLREDGKDGLAILDNPNLRTFYSDQKETFKENKMF